MVDNAPPRFNAYSLHSGAAVGISGICEAGPEARREAAAYGRHVSGGVGGGQSLGSVPRRMLRGPGQAAANYS